MDLNSVVRSRQVLSISKFDAGTPSDKLLAIAGSSTIQAEEL